MLSLILIGLLFKGFQCQIVGYGNTTAEYGRDAYYKCKIANSTGVLQVTWQRLFDRGSIENLASYSKMFGQQVNEPYGKKVVFTEASLDSSSITVTNVTWEDEGCYICSFTAYPGGSKGKQICLTVQGLFGVKTESISDDPDEGEDVEVQFSCSAASKPAPTIDWIYPLGTTVSDQPQTKTVANGDRTFTTSSNITLEVPQDWKGHVDCLLNKGRAGQRWERVPYSLSKKGHKTGQHLSSSGIALVVTAVIFLAFIALAAAMKWKRLKGTRKPTIV